MEKHICSGQRNGKAAKARILLLEIIGREAKGKERNRKTARTRIGLHEISFQKKYEVENQRFAPQGGYNKKSPGSGTKRFVEAKRAFATKVSILLRRNAHATPEGIQQ